MAELSSRLSAESFGRVDRPRAQSEGPVASPRLLSSWVRRPPQIPPALPPFVHDLTTAIQSGGARTEVGSVAVDMRSQSTDTDPIPADATTLPTCTPSITTSDWTVPKLIKDNNNFREVRRVSCLDKAWISTAEECEHQGVPLIVEDWQAHPSWNGAFDANFLVAKHPDAGRRSSSIYV